MELERQDVELRIGEYLEHFQPNDLLDARIGTKTSVYIDLNELFKVDPDLAEMILEKPDWVLSITEAKVEQLTKDGIILRIKNLPGSENVPVRLLREKHIGKMVAIHGIVRRASEIRPRLDVAAFECRKCGAINHVRQDADDTKVREPEQCSYEEGGCGEERPKWSLKTEQSTYTDSQEVELSEAPEGMRGGAQPERIICFVEGDLTGNDVRISAGDRLILNGEVTARPVKRDSTTFQLRMSVNSVEFMVHEYEELEISDEDKIRFEEEAKKGDMVVRIAKCIAPSIKGMESVKQAMALQQFGGQSAKIEDGTVIRGDIHVLLVGDPGVAKTVLIRSIADIAPRTVFATGGASSKVGMTATAVRDDTTGRWTLEAGALVLADKGVAIIDEIDKMEKTDMASMHEAMEQQTVTVTKAGINSTLQSRCSVLGALNPKYGRFIPEEPIATQIDLPPALISRFDLIFALRDVPDTKKDTDIAIHIGARRSRALPKPEFEIDFIKKYIAYARSKIVRLTYGEGVEKFITKYYTDMRGRSKDSVSITARQIEGIYRLAEASARSRLSDVVSIDDARLAVNIVHEYLAKMTMDESGNFDIDRVSTSTSSSERSKIELVIKLLKEGGKDQEELVTASHIASDNLEKVLDRLSRAGTIYKDAQGIWRIV